MDYLVYRCGECELDAANHTFRRSGKEYPLEPKVFAVLTQLLMRPGELLTRDQLLDAVWGHRYVSPSTLNRVIALARRSLLDDGEGPKLIQTVHGSGYRYVGPVEKGVLTEGRVRFGPPTSVRLPGRLQHLIGRGAELQQIDRLLGEGRSLTIVGAGGMGKTQCALAYAHDCPEESFPDGIWFFDLAPRRGAHEWLQAVALSLAITASGERKLLLERITESLADRRALLLLDNCDRLSVEVGALVVELLRGTDRLKILATSQQQLGFVSERVLRMPPLGLPRIGQFSDAHELGEIAAAPAAALLLARIRDVQEDFKLTAANAPAIVAICERLDGMPLALELAAARFALLSPEQVLERLDSRFGFLVSGAAGRDQRHTNLIALLEWGYALLSPDEKRLLAWLGVFVQGFTVDAIIDLAPTFGTIPETAIDLLSGLVSKSLTSVDHSLSPPRYRLLESVREFALEQLRALGDERRARDAHLDYIVRMTDAAREDMLGSRMRERIALLIPEHGNIDSASEYAVGAGGNPQAALKIPGQLVIYFKSHGESGLAIRLCERALACAPSDWSRERARAQLCRGINLLYGIKVAADRPLLEAVNIAREVGDEWTEAYASGKLALWLIHVGADSQAAVPHLATIERLAESRDDELLRGLAGLARGWLYLAHEDIGKALTVLRSVHALSTDFHQHHFIGMYIGLSLFRLGEFTLAAFEWNEAMRNAIAVGHLRGVSGSLEGCAYLAEQLGRPEEACRYLSAAEQMRQRAGSPLFSFWLKHNEDARAALRLTLGSTRYEAAEREGARMHAEDAMNEAAGLLRQFAAGPMVP